MDFSVSLRRLGSFFDQLHMPWAVVGSLGMAAYGVQRDSPNITVLTAVEAREPLLGFLTEEGYVTTQSSGASSRHRHRDRHRGRIVVLYIRGDTAHTIFSNTQPRQVLPEVEAPVPQPKHLVALKVHALTQDPRRRTRDLEDIRNLLRSGQVPQMAVQAIFEQRGLSKLFPQVALRD
ncbi:MAG: nucleotidyl transferase AbiEii/AbiGii toxin family protein [Acidobacteriota bacterium]